MTTEQRCAICGRPLADEEESPDEGVCRTCYEHYEADRLASRQQAQDAAEAFEMWRVGQEDDGYYD